MASCAITDHGVVAGAISFYKACKEKGVHPAIGCEFYLSPTDDHTRAEKIEGLPPYYHLTTLAKNAEGVRELYRLSSRGFLEGFYHKPRISLPMLEEVGKNLIVMGACAKGPISWNILNNNPTEAERYIRRLRDLFGEDFYIELMDHGLDWQKPLNVELERLCKDHGVTWVPTNDAHFLHRQDHFAHCIMMCLQLKKKITELQETGMQYPEECYVKSPREEILQWGLEACKRTVAVSEKIDITLELDKPHFPSFALGEPDGA
jgi:DNA polymerase-3 subunit alpha